MPSYTDCKSLNLGCGFNRISSAWNIDSNAEAQPDQVVDLTVFPWPFADKSFEMVYFFHTIEHIPSKFHPAILDEIHRILKSNSFLCISYPEFTKCASNYINNIQGNRGFWEATIYGRQTDKWDFHVALMDTDFFKLLLKKHGFRVMAYKPEPDAAYYTFLTAEKCSKQKTYEDVIREEIFDGK